MTNPEIREAILDDLAQYASHSRKEKVAINHPTSMEVFGLMVSDLRMVIAKWQKKLKDFTPGQWIDLALDLVNARHLECQLVAYEFLWKNKKALLSLTQQQIIALGGQLDNWVSVDMYCLSITGYCWRMGLLPDHVLEQWAKNENLWIRRAALVSTVPLNLRARGGTGDVERTLRICQMLVDDRQDMVIKALSWALRELSKSDRQAVKTFMEQHGQRIHSRVKREVETKLQTGKKIMRQNA